MTAWTTISNALVAVGAKPFATTIQALRDNVAAALEGVANSPVTAAGWHPYNKVLNGDANTGLIYDFAVSGAVANVVTPDFVDGYEYRIRFESYSQANSVNFRLELFQETAAAYSGLLTIIASNATTFYSGQLVLPFVRRAVIAQRVEGFIVGQDVAGFVGNNTINSSLIQTAQKITRARLSPASGNIDGGKVFLDKRTAAY